MHTVTTDPFFAKLSKEEVEAALKRYDAQCEKEHATDVAPEPDDIVAQEIARLIGRYVERFEAIYQENGKIPDEALLYQPPSPIEQVAFGIFSEALHDSIID